MTRMQSVRASAGCAAMVLWSAAAADGSITMSSGLGTTHTGNLVTNGSFELPPLPDGTQLYWADPGNSPYAPIPAWSASGPNSSAVWGNDGAATPYRLKSSDALPDGRLAVHMGTTTNTTVNVQPVFNPNGSVTFASTPTFNILAGAPVELWQQLPTDVIIAPSYNMSFWVSGVENATNQGNTGVGFLGLQVTNVAAGDPVHWLVAPNGFLPYGMSKLYEFTFTPTNPLVPVEIRFVNPGGMDLSAYGGSPFGTQPILDDVIVNAVVPEPASLSATISAAALLLGRRRR